jgi:error-prone DNA polymerase
MDNYAELHAYSNFTFLEGASHPEQLAQRAAELGLRALAVTDRDGLYGAVRFAVHARKLNVPAIIGSELTIADGTRLTLLIEDARGYANLCELISSAQMRGSKGTARLELSDLDGRTDGLLALSRLADSERTALLRDRFGERCYLELQHHLTPGDAEHNERLLRIARELRVPYVATNGVHYSHREDAHLADILACVKETITLDEARKKHLLRPNSEYHLKSAAAMRAIFRDHPEAVDASLAIAERCAFRLEKQAGQFPLFPVPGSYTRQSYLRELVYKGAAGRYGTPLANDVERQLEYELGIIAKMDLAGYFLIVWDIVNKANELGVLCQGRGSAANSAVCYSLGITAVDPIGMNLLFERFMSEERQEIPDIDIDFAHQDREKIIQYIYDRYGRSNAAMAAEVISYRTRSALRDVAKTLGYSLEQVDEIAKEFDARESLAGATGQEELGGSDAGSPGVPVSITGERAEWLFNFCRQIDGFPRHMGIHSGGMVITRDPLIRVAPVEWATMRDRTIIQWDKDDLQELGLIKIDLLGLGMLSLLREAFSLHKRCVQRSDVATLDAGRLRIARSQDGESAISASSVFTRCENAGVPAIHPAQRPPPPITTERTPPHPEAAAA